jgi:hypothetical protein
MASFFGVPVVRPSCETVVQLLVQRAQDFLANHCPIVLTPTGDDRVELPDQVLLSRRLVVINRLGYLLIVTFNRVFTRFNERLEAASLSVILASRVLPNLEPKELEARFPLFCLPGVSDAGFRRA